MARLTRVNPIGIPQHVIQRGNNHQNCFHETKDMKAYAKWLKQYSQQFEVLIHAWVFMTNHVHLLCTPMQENAISHMMQSIGRQYVRYFNYTYQRTGTLWEGRYKSCLVQEEAYLLKLYRYIELNPVRAGMVSLPEDYSWSSYQVNALGKVSELCTPHPLFAALGKSVNERQANYIELFNHEIDNQTILAIREGIHRGMAIGDKDFIEKVEEQTGCRLHSEKAGRPANKG